LAADDPTYRGVQVPLVFWKVLIYQPAGQDLRTRAFLVTQSLKGLRAVDPLDEFATYQITLTDLAQRTDLTFDDTLINAAAAGSEQMQVLDDGPRALTGLSQIAW
jgi:endonuclease G